MAKKKKKDEETGLEDGSVLSRPSQLNAADIQSQEFRLAFRGYNEKDVDAFLDRVTEEFSRLFEENQRFRGGAPLDGGAAVGDAARAAEEIKRKAREEAAAILANAQAQTGGVIAGAGAAGSSEYMSKFISGERNFLQSLASLIQQHAESVKSTARDAQHAQATAATAAAAALPTTPATSPEAATEAAQPDGETAVDVQNEQAFGSSDAATQTFTAASGDTGTAESAWTATASPAAAPLTSPEPAIAESEPQSRSAGPAETSGQFGAESTSIASVIPIPPSAVDTPGVDLPMESAGDVSSETEFGSGVSVDVEEREYESDEPSERILLPDSPVAEPESEPSEHPGDERSLRDLFWGDE